jgi:predicted transcriptional regulator
MGQIQYETYIPYKHLKAYVTSLVQQNLIEFVKENKKFRITESGIIAFTIIDEMNQLLAPRLTSHRHEDKRKMK